MIEYILIGIIGYLWTIGGFLLIFAVRETTEIEWKNAALVVLIWPFISLVAISVNLWRFLRIQ